MTDNTIHKIRLNQIRPAEQNNAIYNALHEDRIIKLANDIKRRGLLEPLILSRDHVIISGHTRFAALNHLKRKFVDVRYLDIYSTDQNFIEYLTAANNQRVKTPQERLNEIKVNIDPVEYLERAQAVKTGKIDQLQQVAGELKSNRSLSDNYADLCQAIERIIKENQSYGAMSVRGVHYQLLNDPPVKSKQTGEAYTNDQKSYKLLSTVLTKMRVAGLVAHDAIRDDKRKLFTNRGYQDKEIYIKSEIDRLLSTYFRDLMQTQPYYNIIVCEKETLRPQLERVTNKYGLPVVYSQGNSSITIRHDMIADNQLNGSRPMRILVLSDFDPAGYRIQDSLIGSLKQDFDLNFPIEAYRIGITQQQIDKYNLKTSLDAKKTDRQYQKFVDATGSAAAYELDAMKPAQFIAEVEEAILKVIDIDLFNEQVQIYNQDIEDLERKREYIIQHL